MKWLTPAQWLFSFRVCLAMIGAYFATHGDPINAIYAVMGAALVTTPSIGEGIGVSKERLIGTLLGVIVSVPASWLGGPIEALLAISLVVPIGLSLGGVSIARIAVTVAAVGAVLHTGTAEQYGLLRFTNTLAGVAVALLIALAFWPLSRWQGLTETVHAILNASAFLADSLAKNDPTHPLEDAQRKLFQALSNIPKSRTHAQMDPLLAHEQDWIRQEILLVAKIGITLLAVSVTQTRTASQPPPFDVDAICALHHRVATRLRAIELRGARKKVKARAIISDKDDRPYAFADGEPISRIAEDLIAVDAWIDELDALQRVGKQS